MEWTLWQALKTSLFIFWPIAWVLGFFAVFLQDPALGGLAAFFGVTAIALSVTLGLWNDNGKPRKPLPRAERQRIDREVAAKRADRAIEAALQEDDEDFTRAIEGRVVEPDRLGGRAIKPWYEQ